MTNLTEAELAHVLRNTGVTVVDNTNMNNSIVTPTPTSTAEDVEWMKVTYHKAKNGSRNRAIKVTVDIGDIRLKFDSKTEFRAWHEVDDWWTGGLDKVENKPIALYLPGRIHYTPDLLIVDNGRLNFIEVKGSFAAYQSGRNSKSNLKVAATHFQWMADFYALVVEKNKWKLEKF